MARLEASPEPPEGVGHTSLAKKRPLLMPRWTVEAWFNDVNGVRWHYQEGQLETVREPAGIPAVAEPARWPWWRRLLRR